MLIGSRAEHSSTSPLVSHAPWRSLAQSPGRGLVNLPPLQPGKCPRGAAAGGWERVPPPLRTCAPRPRWGRPRGSPAGGRGDSDPVAPDALKRGTLTSNSRARLHVEVARVLGPGLHALTPHGSELLSSASRLPPLGTALTQQVEATSGRPLRLAPGWPSLTGSWRLWPPVALLPLHSPRPPADVLE
jgi:hypothetical protein